MSKILPINTHGACSRLNIFWRCFERRRNADHLRNRQGLRFKLIAHQDQHGKKNGPSDQEVIQNWHSHRPSPSRGSSAWCFEIWIKGVKRSVLQITSATKFAMGTWLKKRQCPLLALSGHRLLRCKCLLLGVKRT